jgi:hypothetical protein
MESTAVWSLKPERWGSLLVEENYKEESACDKRHNNNNNNNKVIIIIIIIITTSDSNGTQRGMFWLRSALALSDVVLICFSSVLVPNPNCNFLVVQVLHSIL